MLLGHLWDGELGLVPGFQYFLSLPENCSSLFIQTERLGLQDPLTPDAHGAPPGGHRARLSPDGGFGEGPWKEIRAGSPGVPPPQALALSPDLPDSPYLSSELPSPSSWPGGDPCPHERRALGPGDRLTSLHLGPEAHTQRWKREPCERSALSSEQCLSSLGASWALGALMEQAGWGFPPDQGSPCQSLSHQGRAGRGGWGPWRLFPAVQAVRMEETWVPSRQTDTQGVSSPGLGLPVTWSSGQQPHRKGTDPSWNLALVSAG